MEMKTNRKTFLATSGFLASNALFSTQSIEAKRKKSRKKVLRIAHITDTHIKPTKKAEEGFAKALHKIQNLNHPPDFILNGGDSILDSMFASKTTTKKLWKTFHKIVKEENSLPIYHCIGNHDVWGWGKNNSTYMKDRLYGKNWVQDEFNLESPYYYFDKANWRFIVLDSVYPKKGGYTARLNRRQFKWLEKTLHDTNSKRNICILSHIPIICFCAAFDGKNEKTGNWKIPGAWMHIDARSIKDLFVQFSNVKLCLSGHIHLHDKVEYLGVKYLCNGAVSGAWWNGSYQEIPPSFAIIDLYNDGSSHNYFIPYS